MASGVGEMDEKAMGFVARRGTHLWDHFPPKTGLPRTGVLDTRDHDYFVARLGRVIVLLARNGLNQTQITLVAAHQAPIFVPGD